MSLRLRVEVWDEDAFQRRYVPWLLCDHCSQPIEDVGMASVEWDENETAFTLHKATCNIPFWKGRGSHDGPEWWDELRDVLQAINEALGLGQRRQRTMKRA